jgi:hypothetical protein
MMKMNYIHDYKDNIVCGGKRGFKGTPLILIPSSRLILHQSELSFFYVIHTVLILVINTSTNLRT